MRVNGGAPTTNSLDVTLNVAGSDSHGLASMCLTNSPGPSSSCSPFVAFVPTKAWRLTDGGAGPRTFCAWLRDARGNTMAGPAAATVQLQDLDDPGPPTATVTINGGEPITSDPAVALNITAQDASGVQMMCVTNEQTAASGCPLYYAFPPTKAWRLAPGASGPRTVTCSSTTPPATPCRCPRRRP